MAVRQDASTGELINDNKHVDETSAPDGKLTMHVKVYSPFKTYFDHPAYSISGENITGMFDILPHHHNFITLLKDCELVIRTETGDQKVKISGGIMHVKADNATVFLDV